MLGITCFCNMFDIVGLLSLISSLVIPVSVCIVAGLVVLTPVFICVARNHFKNKKKSCGEHASTVAFFHPYCNMGGGGERVLWCAIRAIQTRHPAVKIAVYTGDLESSPDEILNRVNQRFNIILPNPVEFIYLRRRPWVEAKMYPYFTLLGQSLGSIILGLEALFSFLPDVYVDSMGYAFTLPLFKYIGCCRTACYVHYPTITSDMLHRVSQRTVAHNNRRLVARSPFLTAGKLLYYRIFSMAYSWAGRCADCVMVNSSWTEDHINDLWKCPLKTHRIYPPCDVNDLKQLPILKQDANKKDKLLKIVSVGQFRPEKDHPLQLRSMYELRQLLPEDLWERVRLTFVGSCRDAEDEQRMRDMSDLCKHLSLENNVEFKVNIPYEELRQELKESVIGLHAMWNEHFGIGVVECMAAGLIMVAHRSGGPRMDIVEEAEGSRNGFLAESEMEYAQTIAAILQLSASSRENICTAARASVDRFSVAEFETGFLRTMQPLLSNS
ncbi:Asparagine-linked glycosylation protein 11-like protein [Gryllus bimaculatus]|nr:Asparagine-linked glycosylation protein 11-like protein [Gryllus bimaculatus]